jgi:hypothetical protein
MATQTQIEKFRQERPALVVIDAGNSRLKACLADDSTSEIELIHEIVFPGESEFNRMKKRAQNKAIEYEGAEFFTKCYRDGMHINAMIGEGVTKNARSNKLTGEAKYREGYFEVLVASLLHRLLPNGHKDIWLAIATPSDGVDYLDRIKEIIGGFHKVETLSGDTISYNVRKLVFWEEPEGGMLRFLARNELAKKAISINSGERIIVIDIGGKISSMSVVRIDNDLEPKVLYGESPQPFNIGIMDAIENFGIELKGLYPQEFQLRNTAESIPEYMKQEGIRTNQVFLSGEPFNVEQARLNALANILDQIETRYNRDLAGGKAARHIIVTGGGGGLLLPILRLDVLKHSSVHIADDTSTIQFANLRGGVIAFLEWLKREEYING